MNYKAFHVMSCLPTERAQTILMMLEDLVEAACLEQARMNDLLVGGVDPGSPEFRRLYSDTHLYLICWDDFRKTLGALEREVPQSWVKQFNGKWSATLTKYRKARDTREHAEQRIFEMRESYRTFYGWFEDNLYHIPSREGRDPVKIGEVTVSVGADSSQLLRQIYDELLATIKQNCPQP